MDHELFWETFSWSFFTSMAWICTWHINKVAAVHSVNLKQPRVALSLQDTLPCKCTWYFVVPCCTSNNSVLGRHGLSTSQSIVLYVLNVLQYAAVGLLLTNTSPAAVPERLVHTARSYSACIVIVGSKYAHMLACHQLLLLLLLVCCCTCTTYAYFSFALTCFTL